MNNKAKCDLKLSRILSGGLLMLSGLLLIFTWEKLFDIILFKVSGMNQTHRVCEKCCIIDEVKPQQNVNTKTSFLLINDFKIMKVLS